MSSGRCSLGPGSVFAVFLAGPAAALTG